MGRALARSETPRGTLCKLWAPKEAQGAASESCAQSTHHQSTDSAVSAPVGAMTSGQRASGAIASTLGVSQATLYQAQIYPFQESNVTVVKASTFHSDQPKVTAL